MSGRSKRARTESNGNEPATNEKEQGKHIGVGTHAEERLTDLLTSDVEKHFLTLSGRRLRYEPAEKGSVIEVSNFPALGKLTALRFIEWVQQNPGGVISLPTGKTPEHFIRWVSHFLKNWDRPETKEHLQAHGITNPNKPDMQSLHFVQMDDFYPIDPTQHNSFHFYVTKYYVRGFGLDPHKCMLIDTWTRGCPEGMNARDVFPDGHVDLSLRHRQPKTKTEELQHRVLTAVDQYCSDYEAKIRKLGGIGFFLGGIGPDGHVAFNIRGSDHFSTTRLTPTNYETQAAAATDLGGIELARRTLVITIGLSTITHKTNVVAIVAAAGEAKAHVITDAVTSPRCNTVPASALHGLPNTRFYLTTSACVKLEDRMFEDFSRILGNHKPLSVAQIDRRVIDVALKQNCRIIDLTPEQLNADRFTNFILAQTDTSNCQQLLQAVVTRTEAKIHAAMHRMSTQDLPPPTNFMHTAPHHDDIMLGYLPFAVHLVRPKHNTHTFNCMTSGFNSVTNTYVISLVEDVLQFLPSFESLFETGYFDTDNKNAYHQDLYHFLDGVAARDEHVQKEGLARRTVRIICTVFSEQTTDQVETRAKKILEYLNSRYPGQKDTAEYQKFKGMIRETEEDLVWGYFGFNEKVNHLRLGFYQGNYFTESPTPSRDVEPILALLKQQKPDVVTVAFDPEGSGPDTHYKVMQAVCQALRFYHKQTGNSNVEVWGYRNVWYRFHPADADLMAPVSLNSMAILDDSFLTCYGSQKNASFPAHEFDGPFSRFAQKIQAEQLQMLKTCLGDEFFESSPLHLLKRTHGFVFLKVMKLEEFFDAARDLEQAVGPDTLPEL